jgi:hypothetical protein
MKKSNTGKEKYQQKAFSFLNEYKMVAYTDGSRLGDSTEYAAAYGNQVIRERLGLHHRTKSGLKSMPAFGKF